KPRSTIDPIDDRKSMDTYASFCAKAQHHWTIHRSLNSYLRHPEHFLSTERELIQGLAITPEEAKDYIDRAKVFKHQMNNAQGNDHCQAFHRVVAQEAVFDGVTNPEWISTTLMVLRDLGLKTDSQRL